jgi:hypothetical protein
VAQRRAPTCPVGPSMSRVGELARDQADVGVGPTLPPADQPGGAEGGVMQSVAGTRVSIASALTFRHRNRARIRNVSKVSDSLRRRPADLLAADDDRQVYERSDDG